MTDIPDTEYITVKRDENGQVGVFVGGKPAIRYRGQEIYDIDYVKETFAGLLKENPNIKEWHVMSSKTPGEYAEVGNPSFEHGENAWCRVKNNDGKLGGWVFGHAYTSASACAFYCASRCADYVRVYAAFRREVLSTAFDKQKPNPEAKPENPEIEKLKAVDLSKLAGKPVQFGGYEIIVRKITETNQNKR